MREVVSLMEGEWLCYGRGQFIGRSMVMLQKCFKEGRMVMLHISPV